MIATMALTRAAGEPVSMLPPRAACASAMDRASVPRVGRNRSARLITSAISCACSPKRRSGDSSDPKASVIAVGVVVSSMSAPSMTTKAKRQA